MKTSRSSQWRAQLGALGLDAEAARAPEARVESSLIEAVRLPALELGARPAGGAARLPLGRLEGALVLLAASLTFFLVRPRPDDLVTRGGSHVSVFWERHGDVRPLRDGGPLAEGDRVRAEILPQTSGTAYWAVVDQSGRALVDTAFLRQSALPLAPHRPAAFPQSLRLVGSAAGESLVVIVCDGAPLDDSTLAAAVPAEGSPVSWDHLPPACKTTSFRLR